MNREDMAAAGLVPVQVVNLVGEHQGQQRTARRFKVVPYDIPRRCVATYFPEANVLVPVDAFAQTSKTPVSKSVPVRIISDEDGPADSQA